MLRKTSTELTWQTPLWLAAMAATSAAFSLALACAAPLAAFAALFALTLDRRNALMFTGAVWFANQAVGYFVLSYPVTANSLEWGAVLGLASIAAALAARSCAAHFGNVSRVALSALAFLVAFAVYEFTLFAAACTMLGGTENFTLAITSWVFEANAIAMALLVLFSRLWASVGMAGAWGQRTPSALR
jgi:hypothetical protein